MFIFESLLVKFEWMQRCCLIYNTIVLISIPHIMTSLSLKVKNFWCLSWNSHKSWIYPMAMCFVPNVYYVCLASAARSILEYCKCCKEKNTTTKGQMKSECIYEIIDFPKYHLKNFCPGRLFRLIENNQNKSHVPSL